MHPIPTVTRVSAGGVVYRLQDNQVEVALILVGPKGRWQLPKGTVDNQETNEDAALREVREETGIQASLISELDRIEYWFYSSSAGKRTRFHKFVYFYLMHYVSGDVQDHDHEVEEARWVEVNQATHWLAFESEREILRKAQSKIAEVL